MHVLQLVAPSHLGRMLYFPPLNQVLKVQQLLATANHLGAPTVAVSQALHSHTAAAGLSIILLSRQPWWK